jgi:hypothetical protein
MNTHVTIEEVFCVVRVVSNSLQDDNDPVLVKWYLSMNKPTRRLGVVELV